MVSYIEPIRFALLVFPFLALAFSSFFLFMNIENMVLLFSQEQLSCIRLFFIYYVHIF
ncbi:MAG: hypothetical protein IC227_06225 [Enterococcus lacertideformus]|uniref:Uncharacterized protein n=1 Tax=Enterococcus lacertideformus TaxID=2771493 RepID=A0A931AUE2_9ENTE|nr:hypothetical protein [Enterococcus lacertideformus]